MDFTLKKKTFFKVIKGKWTAGYHFNQENLHDNQIYVSKAPVLNLVIYNFTDTQRSLLKTFKI